MKTLSFSHVSWKKDRLPRFPDPLQTEPVKELRIGAPSERGTLREFPKCIQSEVDAALAAVERACAEDSGSSAVGRERRLRAELTQEEVAEQTEVVVAKVYDRIERGKLRPRVEAGTLVRQYLPVGVSLP